MFRNRFNLRKVVAIAICLAGSSVTLFAQDVITLKNGDDIKAIVQEVGIDDVKYKKFDNPSGPNYTLKKAEIFMIRYENGSKDVFKETDVIVPTDKKQQVPVPAISTQPELSYKDGVWQNGTKLSADKVRSVMSGNSEALQQYNSGKSLYLAGQIIGYPCAFLFGWDLGTRLAGGEGNGTLLGVGAAGTVVGLIMMFSGESKIKTSVKLYNSKANNSVSYQIDFGFTQTGIGLCMRF